MNLHQMFKTDPALERDGIIVDYGPNEQLPTGEDGESPSIKFRIARAGGNNLAYAKALERLTKPHRRLIQSGQLSNDLAKTISRAAFLDTCLLGWENVTDEAGNVLPFSRENAERLFNELPDLYTDLSEQAANASLFREELREADLGNSGRSLNTDSIKGQ